MIPNI